MTPEYHHLIHFQFSCIWLLSHVQLFCDSMDCSSPGSSVRGISQASILECIVISSSRDLPNAGFKLTSVSPELAGGFFTIEPPGKPFQFSCIPKMCFATSTLYSSISFWWCSDLQNGFVLACIPTLVGTILLSLGLWEKGLVLSCFW